MLMIFKTGRYFRISMFKGCDLAPKMVRLEKTDIERKHFFQVYSRNLIMTLAGNVQKDFEK